jgi:uncharacterized membrane protein YozB (DUF420 family)
VKALFTYQVLPGYQQIAFINVILQIIVLAMLGLAILFRIKGNFRRHGMVMLSAVVLHVILFLLVMGPSFLSLEPFVISQPTDRLSALTLAHIIMGGISIILGLWLVGSWHLQLSIQGCMKRKPIMRITITLWVTSLILGILLFRLLYPTFP